jgi:hypothetical protein
LLTRDLENHPYCFSAELTCAVAPSIAALTLVVPANAWSRAELYALWYWNQPGWKPKLPCCCHASSHDVRCGGAVRMNCVLCAALFRAGVRPRPGEEAVIVCPSVTRN